MASSSAGDQMPSITYNKMPLNPADAGLTGVSTCDQVVAALEARGIPGARLIMRGQTVVLSTQLRSLAGEKLIVVGGAEVDATSAALEAQPAARVKPKMNIDKIPAKYIHKLIETCKHDPSYADRFDSKYGPGTAEAVFAAKRAECGVIIAPVRRSRARGRTRRLPVPETTAENTSQGWDTGPGGLRFNQLAGASREECPGVLEGFVGRAEGATVGKMNDVLVTAKCAKSGQSEVLSGLTERHTVQYLRERVVSSGLASLECQLIHNGRILKGSEFLGAAGVLDKPIVVVFEKTLPATPAAGTS